MTEGSRLVALRSTLFALLSLQAEQPLTSGYLELRLYTVTSNKLDGVLERFRDTVDPVRPNHGISTHGYWTAFGTTNDGTFAYLMSATSREELQRQERDFDADPEWQRVEKETEKDGKLRSNVTAYKLTPADFSPLK